MTRSRATSEAARPSEASRDRRAHLVVALRDAGPDLEAGAARFAAHDDETTGGVDRVDDTRRVLLARLYRRSGDFAATTALKALDTFSAGARARHSVECTGAPQTWGTVRQRADATLAAHERSSMTEHRTAAKQALADGQRNPIMSADQQFAIAQVHVLLAIEERLGELCDLSRLHALGRTTPDSLVPSGSV